VADLTLQPAYPAANPVGACLPGRDPGRPGSRCPGAAGHRERAVVLGALHAWRR